MNKIVLILLFFASTQVAVAQVSKISGQASQQNLNDLASVNNTNGVVNTFDYRYEGVRGTPFNSAYWGTATINVNNLVYQDVTVKYNIFENNLLYKKNNLLLVLDVNKIDSFVFRDSLGLNSHTYKKVNSMTTINPRVDNKFAVALFEGKKSKLITLLGKTLVKADYKGTYSSGKTYDEFIDDNTIYFIDSVGRSQKVKLSKKSLISVLGDKSEQIKEYLAKEKINTSSEDGWRKTLTYYETL